MEEQEPNFADLYDENEKGELKWNNEDPLRQGVSKLFDEKGNPIALGSMEDVEDVETTDPEFGARLQALAEGPIPNSPELLNEAIREQERLLQNNAGALQANATVFEHVWQSSQPKESVRYREALQSIRKKYKAIEDQIDLSAAGGAILSFSPMFLHLAGKAAGFDIDTASLEWESMGAAVATGALWRIGRFGAGLSRFFAEQKVGREIYGNDQFTHHLLKKYERNAN